MPERISDVVWHQLDPRAGALSRRTVRRNWWTGVVLSVATVGLTVTWYLGLVVPRLEVNTYVGQILESGWIRVDLTVTNTGVTPVTVVGASHDAGPSLRFLRAGGDFPRTLGPGASMDVNLQYQVTDCAAVPEVAPPIVAHVHRWWGRQAVDLQTNHDRWQRDLVDPICDPQ